jgi:uncharacterized damage-inducible protein DinB
MFLKMPPSLLETYPQKKGGSLKNFKQKEKTMELLTLEQFYDHWQGHRRLTIRTLEAFPEDKLFSYKVEPMRTFGEIINEIIGVESYTLEGVVSGNWDWKQGEVLTTKDALLASFRQREDGVKELWSKLSSERIQAVEKDAMELTWSNRDRLLYMLDNEIHHRAQGYVYLRLLRIEPPAFWER